MRIQPTTAHSNTVRQDTGTSVLLDPNFLRHLQHSIINYLPGVSSTLLFLSAPSESLWHLWICGVLTLSRFPSCLSSQAHTNILRSKKLISHWRGSGWMGVVQASACRSATSLLFSSVKAHFLLCMYMHPKAQPYVLLYFKLGEELVNTEDMMVNL